MSFRSAIFSAFVLFNVLPHDLEALTSPSSNHFAPSRQRTHCSSTTQDDDGSDPSSFDVILSSGFLCFSRHAGFASSLEDLNLRDRIDRYVGTSSGALAASMLAAGLSADEVATELSAEKRPIAQCRPSFRFWRGALSTRSLQKRLRDILPETFEDLEKPLAVGVYDCKTKQPKLITSGPLVPAVAASCAVPGGMFAPVRLEDGRLYADGGAIDRTFVQMWRDWDDGDDPGGAARASSSAEDGGGSGRKALVHLISSREDGVYSERDGIPDDDDRDDIVQIVRSPRTEGGLFGLGDFEKERRMTRTAVTGLLRERMSL